MSNKNTYNESIAILKRLQTIIDNISCIDNTNIKLHANIVRSECLVCEVRLWQTLSINKSIDIEIYKITEHFLFNLRELKKMMISAKIGKKYWIIIDKDLSCLEKNLSKEVKTLHLSLLKRHYLSNLN